MHNINLTDETFDVNQSHNYVLLMQSSLNGFSYAICDTVRNKCILLKHFEKQSSDWFDYKNFLVSVIESEQNLKLSFKGINHILVQKDFTLFPEEFAPQNPGELHNFIPGMNGLALKPVNSAIKITNSVVICPYPSDLHYVLQKNFNGIKLSHHIQPFVTNLIKESSRTLRHVFHALINDRFIAVGVAHSARLDFANTFATACFEDMLYYLVSILEKYKVSPLLAEIYLQNDSVHPDLSSRLQTYLGKVRNLKASQSMVYSYIFTEDILEQFANMLNLYHCE